MAKLNRAQRHAVKAAVAKATKKVEKAVGVGGDAGVTVSRASMYDFLRSSTRLEGSDLEVYYMLYAKHPSVRTCVTLISEAIGSEGFGIQPISGDRAPGKTTAKVKKAYSRRIAPVSFNESGFIAEDDDPFAYSERDRVYHAKAALNAYGPEQAPDALAIVEKAAAKTKTTTSNAPANPRANDPGTPAPSPANPGQSATTPPPKKPVVFSQQDDDADPRIALLKDFFRRAFPGTTMPRVLLATGVDLTVFAVSYWRKKRANLVVKGSITPGVVALERLDPRRIITRLNDKKTAIKEFVLRNSIDGALDLLNAETIPAEDVIMFTTGGGDPIFGAPSPLEALDLTVSDDFAIRMHRGSFFRNGAVAGMVIVNKDANEDEMKAAKMQFLRDKTGSENVYKTIILPGDSWELLAQAKSGGNDVDFANGFESNRNEIFSVYKVPPGKIFNEKGSLGQAGKTVDDITFQKDAVLPYERSIYETLTIELLDKEFNITDLVLVPKRIQSLRIDMIEVAKSMGQAGATGNEMREMMGLPTVIDGPDDLDMDVPLFLGYKQPFTMMEAEPAPPPVIPGQAIKPAPAAGPKK